MRQSLINRALNLPPYLELSGQRWICSIFLLRNCLYAGQSAQLLIRGGSYISWYALKIKEDNYHDAFKRQYILNYVNISS